MHSCFHWKEYECIWSHNVSGKLYEQVPGNFMLLWRKLRSKIIEDVLEQTENTFCLYSIPEYWRMLEMTMVVGTSKFVFANMQIITSFVNVLCCSRVSYYFSLDTGNLILLYVLSFFSC